MTQKAGSRYVRRGLAWAAAAAALAVVAGCQMIKPMKPVSKYVTVQKIDGRYWFVRGNEKFLALGVNVVQPADSSKPARGGVYNVLSKYSGNTNAWAKDAEARLRSWNFNTVAGWGSDDLYEHAPMYHTRVVWFGPWGSRDSRLIDVFSESYAADVDKTAREQVAPHASNEYLIGWFLNNEMPWYGDRGWPTTPTVSLLSRYMHLPEKAPGKVQLVAFLKRVYSNDFAAFSANWDTKATSFDDLAKQRQILPKQRVAARDTVAWSGVVAEQYFKLCHETLRRYDPNHLFLGIRFAERAQEPVMAACGKYADVVSVNHYRKTGCFDARQVGAISALAGKPVMITEFSFRAMENSSGCPNSRGADVTVKTQQDRADRFRTYATNALAQPFLVGYDWFMYHDQPPGGRFDGEDSNYGLVDIHDNPYTTLLAAITEVNGRAAQIHEQSATPLPAYDPSVLADYRDITVPGLDRPLAAPVVFVDSTSTFETWGDFPGGAKLAGVVTGGVVRVTGSTARGWGAGITFQPRQGLPKNPDGSVNVYGARRIVVKMTTREGVKFSIGFQESGHGPTDAQTFRGYGNADGESYTHADVQTKHATTEYAIELRGMDQATGYGNQRGNSTVDTDAAAQIHVFFPGGQSDLVVDIESIRVE